MCFSYFIPQGAWESTEWGQDWVFSRVLESSWQSTEPYRTGSQEPNEVMVHFLPNLQSTMPFFFSLNINL